MYLFMINRYLPVFHTTTRFRLNISEKNFCSYDLYQHWKNDPQNNQILEAYRIWIYLFFDSLLIISLSFEISPILLLSFV